MIPISDQLAHPGFDIEISGFQNDFMLLRLSEDAPPGYVVSISNDVDDVAPGTALTVLGLGVLETGQFPFQLTDVTVQAFNDSQCQEAYDPTLVDLGFSFVPENMFCAGVDGGGKDACAVSAQPLSF